jgi:hypothetical protein
VRRAYKRSGDVEMRTGSLLVLGLVTLSAACATSVRSFDPDSDNSATEGEAASKGNTIPGEKDDDTPHALGTIVLGETRASQTGSSSPVVSASFVPDASLVKSCTKSVGACEVSEIPKCTTGTAQGCGVGELCTFDDACRPKCVKQCTKACAAGEECIFSSNAPAADEGMACAKRDRFDAGAIAFAGTTTALTLFPPYAISPEGNGAPFMPKSEIRVQASGAASAGFEAFDETFTTTTFLETEPPLREIPRATVFGAGAVPISWVPGDDVVVVRAIGPAGSAECEADDAEGRFDLPRAVVREIVGTAAGTPTLTVSVTRERREVKKGKKTVGSLSGGLLVQPVGWLELVTSSTESHSFASCTSGLTMCGEQCVNTLSDARNCGRCDYACPSGYYCSSGVCR